MSRWKKIALFGGVGIAVVTVGIGVSRAAGPGGFLDRRARLVQLLRELQVTRDQRTQLRDAAVHLGVERRALELEDLSPAERGERLFQLRRNFFAQAERTLTPEQRTRLKSRWEANHAARQQAFAQKALAAADRLQLTSDQRAQARDLFAAARERRAALQGDASLDEPSRLARALGIFDDTRRDLYRLLTPSQRTKAKELLELRLRNRFPIDGGAGADAVL